MYDTTSCGVQKIQDVKVSEKLDDRNFLLSGHEVLSQSLQQEVKVSE